MAEDFDESADENFDADKASEEQRENLEGTADDEASVGAVETLEGAYDFSQADSFNVPVHVGLHPEIDSDTQEETGHFVLRADGYLSRKDKLEEDMFGVRSKDPDQLRKIVTERIIPIYQGQLADLEAMAEGTKNNAYSWGAPDLPDPS